mgnify:CR=1 FL=1
MFWLWMMGAFFTDGLLDPKDEQGFLVGCKRVFYWPCELGVYLNERLTK